MRDRNGDDEAEQLVTSETKEDSELPRDTYDTIIRVATELFRHRGFNGTGVAQIAQTVGITNAALYYYFASKQDLLFAVLERGMAGQLEILEEIASKDAPITERLLSAVDNHLDLIFERPDAVRVFLRERRFLTEPHRSRYALRVKRYDALFEGLIAEGVAAGELPKDDDPRLLRLAVLGMLNWISEWYNPEGPTDEVAIRSTMVAWTMTRLLQVSNDQTPEP